MQTHEEKLATGSTYVGGVIAALSGLTLNEWGVIIGIALGVAGFATNLWFKWHVIKLAKKSEKVHFDVD